MKKYFDFITEDNDMSSFENALSDIQTVLENFAENMEQSLSQAKKLSERTEEDVKKINSEKMPVADNKPKKVQQKLPSQGEIKKVDVNGNPIELNKQYSYTSKNDNNLLVKVISLDGENDKNKIQIKVLKGQNVGTEYPVDPTILKKYGISKKKPQHEKV